MPRLGLSPLVGGLITTAVLSGFGFWMLPPLFPQWLAPFWLSPTARALQAVAHGFYGVVFGIAYRSLADAHRWVVTGGNHEPTGSTSLLQ